MKTFILLLLLSSNSSAGLLDFFKIHQAENAYENKDYSLASEKFSAIDNDSAKLNHGNSLYKQGLYKQALVQYNAITQDDLAFDRLYNSGNAYAKSGQINDAIDSYEKALKLKKDEDALFNLGLVRKQKSKSKNNRDDKSGQSKKSKNNRKNDGKNKKRKKLDKPPSGKKMSMKQQREKLENMKLRRLEEELKRRFSTLMIPLKGESKNKIDDDKPW